MATPFPDIAGPHYVYILGEWVGSNWEPIYVGRGRGKRGKDYYKISRRRGRPPKEIPDRPVDLNPYFYPETHNTELNNRISEIRLRGQDITIYPFDCGESESKAKRCEKCLIARYGRKDLNTGKLLNRNAGG